MPKAKKDNALKFASLVAAPAGMQAVVGEVPAEEDGGLNAAVYKNVLAIGLLEDGTLYPVTEDDFVANVRL